MPRASRECRRTGISVALASAILAVAAEPTGRPASVNIHYSLRGWTRRNPAANIKLRA